MTPELLTLEQTAKVLQINYPRAEELARRNILPAVGLGRQVRVSASQLEGFIASSGKAAHAPEGSMPDTASVARRVATRPREKRLTSLTPAHPGNRRP